MQKAIPVDMWFLVLVFMFAHSAFGSRKPRQLLILHERESCKMDARTSTAPFLTLQ